MGFLNADGLKYAWQTYIAKALDKKVDKISGKGLSTNDYTNDEKTKLAGIAAGAEANQNAFSNIKVGNTTIAADNKTDTLNLVAGENVTITPTEGSDTIEIKAKDTIYTHPTYTAKTAGLYKITVDEQGHISGATAVSKEDITALGIPAQDTNTTYTGSDGITLTGTNFTNSGVRSISKGSNNGTVKVNTNGTEAEVAVAGLKSAAYTESSAYATADQGTKADNAMPKSGGAFDGYITLKGDPTANLHPVTKQYLDSELLELGGIFDDKIADEIGKITHPITSVNGKTGVVKLTAEDVGALPSTTSIPSIEGLATETFVTNITNNKVDKVAGKDLSTNDYTTTEKNKLAGIAEGANKTIIDTALSSTSTNPVQNKVVNTAINNLSTLMNTKLEEAEVFIAIYNTTTYQEVIDAVNAGRIVQAKGEDNILHNLAMAVEDACVFTQVDGQSVYALILTTGNEWQSGIIPLITKDSFSINNKMLDDAMSITLTASDIGAVDTDAFTSHSGNKNNPHSVTKSQIGLGNVENKSAATILSELTKSNVTTALGYTPLKDHITVDSQLSTTSTNPVQNKVINTALAGKSDSTHKHTASEVGADAAGSANTALTDAKKYTDDKIALVMNNSSTAVDSIMELAAAMEENDDVVAALEEAIGKKSDSGHTHNYAGSSSAGGAATSANKLNTNAGSVTQPVYFANGIPVKTTYTLGASVPSDAKFTDTTYSVATASVAGLMSAADKKKLDYINISYDSTSNTVTFS